jgi:hypothetical protein
MEAKRKLVKIIDGAIADATGKYNILGAKKVVLFCKRSAHTAGNTVFSATVGVAGNEITYSKWISNATNTNAQTETRVASLTLSSATSGFLTMSPEDTFDTITVTADVTTDGTNDVWLILDY